MFAHSYVWCLASPASQPALSPSNSTLFVRTLSCSLAPLIHYCLVAHTESHLYLKPIDCHTDLTPFVLHFSLYSYNKAIVIVPGNSGQEANCQDKLAYTHVHHRVALWVCHYYEDHNSNNNNHHHQPTRSRFHYRVYRVRNWIYLWTERKKKKEANQCCSDDNDDDEKCVDRTANNFDGTEALNGAHDCSSSNQAKLKFMKWYSANRILVDWQ